MLRGGKLYIIWNDINDKVYVGITSRRLSRRFHEHVYASLNHKDKFQFHSAIRKYGEEHFHMECLLDDVPIERLPLFEKACIEHFDSYKNGYNSTPGGDGTGKEVTEEFRQKMSKIHKGKTPWNKGVPMPEYIKEKLLAAHVGKKHSEETCRKMSEARKGRKPFLGRKHSAETRLKMSRSQNERFNNERRYV